MRIGIIGAGNIGGTVARRLRELGHEVRVANSRGPETLADLVQETGAMAVRAYEAAEGADLVIVTGWAGHVLRPSGGVAQESGSGSDREFFARNERIRRQRPRDDARRPGGELLEEVMRLSAFAVGLRRGPR